MSSQEPVRDPAKVPCTCKDQAFAIDAEDQPLTSGAHGAPKQALRVTFVSPPTAGQDPPPGHHPTDSSEGGECHSGKSVCASLGFVLMHEFGTRGDSPHQNCRKTHAR